MTWTTLETETETAWIPGREIQDVARYSWIPHTLGETRPCTCHSRESEAHRVDLSSPYRTLSVSKLQHCNTQQSSRQVTTQGYTFQTVISAVTLKHLLISNYKNPTHLCMHYYKQL